MTLHAMIDIETLGVGIGVPLFEIGVVIFDPEKREIIDEIQFNVDLLDVILTTGFSTQGETIKWWQKQDYDPRTLPRLSLKNALLGMTDMLESNEVSHVWGNSPAFDMVILTQHYAACGLPVPWRYSCELDFRTVKWVYRTVNGDPDGPFPVGVSHNALEDAKMQTKILFSMFGGLKSEISSTS